MPYAVAADGTRIWYDVSGRADGEPILMIQGLGADSRGWIFQRRALGRRHRVICVDNRGVGRSDRPPGPYDLEVMAADAMAALTAAGFGSAHVVGASMGGVISQIIAVRYPERVRSLVLACTSCSHHDWRRELFHEWAETARSQGMRALVNRAMRWLIGQRVHRRFGLPMGLLGNIVLATPADTFVAQIDAILAMDDSLKGELHQVQVPTLVTVGTQDILTPAGDAEEIVELIPGADLALISGAAHGFMVEHAGAFNALLVEFYERVTAGRAEAAPDVEAATA